jgi:hypothetical protein
VVGSAVAFPKSIEFWKDRRIIFVFTTLSIDLHDRRTVGQLFFIAPSACWPSHCFAVREYMLLVVLVARTDYRGTLGCNTRYSEGSVSRRRESTAQ